MEKCEKKLIVIKSTGNHSNRLIQNLHFEVFCKKYGIQYLNPTFEDMATYYVEPCCTETNLFYKILQIDLLGRMFRHSRIVKKLFSVVWLISKLGLIKFIRFDKKGDEKYCENYLLRAFETKNTIYVAGWSFRVPKSATSYREEMCKNYSLKKIFYQDNLLVNKVEKLRSEGYYLVGVHIRRGDYKKWKNGKYYYSDEIYEKHIETIKSSIEGKVAFILFSNDKVKFQESDNIIVSKEDWFVDQYVMSLCDCLLGPPSTFTLWASYMGNVKLYHIFDAENLTVIY